MKPETRERLEALFEFTGLEGPFYGEGVFVLTDNWYQVCKCNSNSEARLIAESLNNARDEILGEGNDA